MFVKLASQLSNYGKVIAEHILYLRPDKTLSINKIVYQYFNIMKN